MLQKSTRSWQKSISYIPSSSATSSTKILDKPATLRSPSTALRTPRKSKSSTPRQAHSRAIPKLTGMVSKRGWQELYQKSKTFRWRSSSAEDEAIKTTPTRSWQKSISSIPTSSATSSSKMKELPATWRSPSTTLRTLRTDKSSTQRKAPIKATLKMTGTGSQRGWQQP